MNKQFLGAIFAKCCFKEPTNVLLVHNGELSYAYHCQKYIINITIGGHGP